MNSFIKNIVDQLNLMSCLNIMSFSLLSGSGISVSPSLLDLDIIEELCKDMPPNQRPYNVFFMSSLYKKGMPIYAKEIANPYDFESYNWLNQKRKKIIDIRVMAGSIISCCSLVEKLLINHITLENNQFITFLLFRTAFHQAKFIKHYLKIGDLYYSGEDISENNKELHIEITSKEPDIVSQLLVLQAFTALKRLAIYNIPYLYLKDSDFEEDFALLHPLYDNIIEHISEIELKDLVSSGLSIVEIYVKNEHSCNFAYNALTKIASELQKRINAYDETTDVSTDSHEISAKALFDSLNLLSQLYYMFGNKTYYHTCLKIYRKLNPLWIREHGIFKTRDSNKQSYSIKDISSYMASLLSFHIVLSDSEMINQIEEQISALYETVFAKSGIFQGQKQPVLQQCIISPFPTKEAPKDAVPVFGKAFEYKISKSKFYCDSDVFKADYVIPACCTLLNNISNYCM